METTIPRQFRQVVQMYGDSVAQYSKDHDGAFQPITYAELAKTVEKVAGGLYSLGVSAESRVGLIADNRKEWLEADLALLYLRAADVPRGTDATDDEVAYILSFSEVEVSFVETEVQLKRLSALTDRIPKLTTVIVLDPQFQAGDGGGKLQIIPYNDLLKRGEKALSDDPELIERSVNAGSGEDVATLIFTSGTTGEPKGVMLQHKAFLHQVAGVPGLIGVGKGDIWLCVLPVWHSFERIMQYVAIGMGCSLAYSKPIGHIMLEDFQKIRPTWMASVPRIWEAVMAGIYRNVRQQGGIKAVLFHFFVAVGGAYSGMRAMFLGRRPRFHRRSRLLDAVLALLPTAILWPLKKLGDVLVFKKIQDRLGGRFVAGISGGGALPQDVDRFFSAAGITLLEGYGLTESGPVLGVRPIHHPVAGTVGPVFPGTEVKVLDPESGKQLPPGHKGLIYARGPQIMVGYYKKPDLTKAVLDDEGWLNTGDLGMLTYDNEIRITGRAKDTIVLRGGENVEPLPIEQRIRQSEFVEQAVLLGQDQKFLAVLIVPDFSVLEAWAKDNNVAFTDRKTLVTAPEVRSLYEDVVKSEISGQNGFKAFERVYRVGLLPNSFELGKELSAKQEVKRHVVTDLYKREIDELFR